MIIESHLIDTDGEECEFMSEKDGGNSEMIQVKKNEIAVSQVRDLEESLTRVRHANKKIERFLAKTRFQKLLTKLRILDLL